jgi:hypothetical protein
MTTVCCSVSCWDAETVAYHKIANRQRSSAMVCPHPQRLPGKLEKRFGCTDLQNVRVYFTLSGYVVVIAKPSIDSP